MNYAFTDVESSGLAKLRNGVITFATYITDTSYNILDELYLEIRPDGAKHVVWSDKAEEVHGITWDRAIKFPPITEQVPVLKSFLDKYGPLEFIAHNMPFDRRMVRELFEKTNHISSEFDKYFPVQECTLKMLRNSGLYTGKSKSLGPVCEALGIAHDHHDARSDAFVLIEIHKRITEHLRGNEAPLLEGDENHQGEWYES